MKVAIMQPYFLPYVGYFSLIKHVDQFILFDTPQYIRHGWIERNRVLKQNGELFYVKVPLNKHQRETKIKDIRINNSENWKNKILAQLIPYRKIAPNYMEVIKLLKEILEYETESIVELNYISLKKICDYLNIITDIKIWSEMDMEIEEVKSPDEWALNICKALNVDEYYNAIGGNSFFDKSKYENAGIALNFIETEPITYKQFSNEFVPYLSIIDVMMFCNKEQINSMIDNVNFSN